MRTSKEFHFNKKTITSGNIIEQMIYEKEVTHGKKLTPSQLLKRKNARHKKWLKKIATWEGEPTTPESRRLSMYRAKKKLTRLIDSNIYQYANSKGRIYPPVFLTLTFAEDIRNQKQGNLIFSLFIKRLNYEINKEKSNTLKYSVVIEFQDKTREGVIHYHVIFYNLPFIKKEKLDKIWDKGYLNVKEVKKSKSISRYVTKYMAKNFDDTRLDKHKRYFSSRGLIKPRVYLGDIAYEKIRNVIPANTPKWEKDFDTRYKGKITKTIFTLPNKDDLSVYMDQEEFQEIKHYDIS